MAESLNPPFQDIIAHRRDGSGNSETELRAVAMGAASGAVPDYQLSAWLMAAVLKPLSVEETAALTLAMVDSGERLDLTSLPHPWVDKHSTGGVGDKTTIALLPLLASCGLTLVKMSGRGLGITGGTIDKLESLPGFRTDLTPEEMVRQAGQIGLALTGQTPRLAPADKALYALRDATGTVRSAPLIASSILSKKIAGSAEVIVIDLKCGNGAFMQDLDEAKRLADLMLQVAERCGVKLKIAITSMDAPLGRAVGNLLETREAINVLNGRLKNRFYEHCLAMAAIALQTSGKAPALEVGRAMAIEAIESRRALQKMGQWFEAQGCKEDLLSGANWDPAPCVIELEGPASPQVVTAIHALQVGQISLDLGGGRHEKTDAIDHRVGIEFLVEVGATAEPGEPMALIYAASDAAAQNALVRLKEAIQLGDSAPPSPLIYDIV